METTAPASEADKARQRIREGREALMSQKQKSAAVTGKHHFAEEAQVHDADDTNSSLHASSATRKRSAHTATARSAAGSSARYLSSRGRASARYTAMTARDEEDRRREREAFQSARQSARRSARRATARFHAKPLPMSTPQPAEWRKWPSGRPEAEVADTSALWASASEAHLKGGEAVSAFIGAAEMAIQAQYHRDDEAEAAAVAAAVKADLRAAALAMAAEQEGKRTAQAEGEHDPEHADNRSANHGAEHTASPKPYGSRRPLSAKERGFQVEKATERMSRRRIAELKANAREEAAREELESKRRRHDLRRAKQRSARGKGLSPEDRTKIQQRLYATPRRERAGAVYA